MKILIVQLLRLGDVIMSSPVIQGLRDQYPNAEIDLLINKQFAGVLNLLPKVDQHFTFERNLIQSSLGEQQRFVLEGFDRTAKLLQSLQERGYDQIINLTHNKLSGYLVGAIDCRSRVGLWVDNENRMNIESLWFDHLNQDHLGEDSERFHFVDIYKASVQIDRPRLGISLFESAAGRKIAFEYLKSKTTSGPHIVIQALTSDSKKNWGIEQFTSCIQMIQESLVESHFTILGSASEEKELRAGFSGFSFCTVLICDLDTAYSVILNADLIVTGDTSIKHLAAATKIPIVELSIGSSEFNRTGSYSENAIIVQSAEECSPCRHSVSCHRTAHFCGSRVSPELISILAIDIIRNQALHLKTIAIEFADEAKIFRVDIRTTGTWMAFDIAEEAKEQQFAKLFHKFATKLYIQHRSKEKDVFEVFGSEADRLATLLKSTSNGFTSLDCKKFLNDFEEKFFLMNQNILLIENHFYQHHFSARNSEKSGEALAALAALKESARPFTKNRDSAVPPAVLVNDQMPSFVRLRKVQLVIQEMKLMADIELKLIRSVQCTLQNTREV